MNISDILAQIHTQRVLVVGDAMLDEYIEGQPSRISPEAPVLVLRDTQCSFHVGGASNVVRNITALGGRAHLIAACGTDSHAQILKDILTETPQLQVSWLADKTRPTTLKIRHIAQGQHLLRSDIESSAPLSPNLELALMRNASKIIKQVDYVILSDYAKGVLNDSSLPKLIALAKKHNVPMVIDPKKRDWTLFYGADLVTPNKNELMTATAMPVQNDAEITRAARKIIKRCGVKALLVTRSEQGMSYVSAKQALHIPAKRHSVFDVAGAGDTVIAALALALGTGASIHDAMQLANMAAAVAVSKRGTACVSPQEILHSIPHKRVCRPQEKIMNRAALRKKVADWRAHGLTVGFTNGCFDMLHHGHVQGLEQAAQLCDRLIVGLNDDRSLKALKGDARPINPQTARSLVLAGLQAVDGVCVFREDTPLALIEAVKPDMLFKGEDYALKEIVGARFVTKNGGQVKNIPLVAGVSTSALIAKIQSQAVPSPVRSREKIFRRNKPK